MGVTGSISRLFMFGANTTEVHGLDGFLELLDKRSDVRSRQRGLITGLSCTSMIIAEELKVDWMRSVEPYMCVRMYLVLQRSGLEAASKDLIR